MTAWYKVSKWDDTEIVRVDVQRETEKRLLMKDGRWRDKSSEYYEFFETEKEARDAIRKRLKYSIETARRRISVCEETLANIDKIMVVSER